MPSGPALVTLLGNMGICPRVTPQAPPVAFEGSFESSSSGFLHPGLCVPLRDALVKLQSGSALDDLGMISGFREPIGVTRQTMASWADGLLGGPSSARGPAFPVPRTFCVQMQPS